MDSTNPLRASWNLLSRHWPAIAIVAASVLNILIKDGSISLSTAWVDTINAVLGVTGLSAHINNHR